MKRTPATPRKAPARPAARAASSASAAGKSSAVVASAGSGVVSFAAARAQDIADTLHQMATRHINEVARSANTFPVDSLWRRAQPLVRRAGGFVRDYPLRSGMIVALLAGAALLTRTPVSIRS